MRLTNIICIPVLLLTVFFSGMILRLGYLPDLPGIIALWITSFWRPFPAFLYCQSIRGGVPRSALLLISDMILDYKITSGITILGPCYSRWTSLTDWILSDGNCCKPHTRIWGMYYLFTQKCVVGIWMELVEPECHSEQYRWFSNVLLSVSEHRVSF